MHGPCSVESATREANLDLGIVPPKISAEFKRQMIVYRRKQWVMKQLERIPFFSY
jgi:hypothetical protein